MKKIEDKKIVYTTIEEILDPSHTALVIWDVVRALERNPSFTIKARDIK
jgi:hypothetical protein